MHIVILSNDRKCIGRDATLEKLQFADESGYNSSKGCLYGTRKELIGEIMDWCGNVDHAWQAQMVLLTAVAGTGKSTVAHTIAHSCAEHGILLSSFFFKEGKTTSPKYLWSGVARSLAIRSKSYCQMLTSALENDPGMATAAFDEQFRRLILEPLRHGSPPADSPLVIVIDALDECDEDASQALSELLRDSVAEFPRCVKFLLTSRPVRVVDDYFHSSSSIHRMRIELSDDKNLRDCEAYIHSQVLKLKELPRVTTRNWLPDLEQKLVTQTGGLFVWVSIVMEYLKNKSTDPVVALEDLLDQDASRDDVPAEEKLDALYAAILSKCNWKDRTFKHDYPIVMGAIVTAKSPLSIIAWTTLLSPFLKTSFENIISELRPLLSGTGEQSTPIQLLHQSFRDYLKWRGVSKLQILEPAVDQERLALRCFEVINTEIRKVAGLGIVEKLGELEEMPMIPQTNISEHMAYACRYWLDHILDIQRVPGALETEIEKFLQESITNWLELCVRTERYISIYPFFDWIDVSHGSGC